MFRFVVLFASVLSVATAASISERIVGGKLTDISKHAHQISMRYKGCNTCSFRHLCGGSIVTPSIILTAAHCVVGISQNPKQYHIVAGANEPNGPGVIIPVKKIVAHEDYQRNMTYENDIAILVLEIALQLNEFDIKAIKMTDKRPEHNEISQITGWGTTTGDGYPYPADFLLEVEVRIISNKICEERYGTANINESMLCAGSTKGGKGFCIGDAGGPLLVKGVLAGVVSWSIDCARPEYPGVYASVSDLRPWIDAAIKANS